MAPGTNEKVVSEWVDAFNERDLDGMLARVNPDVLFHPLRVNGTAHTYLGHDGIRRWFAEILQREHPHRIGLKSIAGLTDGRMLAAGTVLVEKEAAAPFSGLYEIENGVIVCAYHYFTPPETLVQIGIVRSRDTSGTAIERDPDGQASSSELPCSPLRGSRSLRQPMEVSSTSSRCSATSS